MELIFTKTYFYCIWTLRLIGRVWLKMAEVSRQASQLSLYWKDQWLNHESRVLEISQSLVLGSFSFHVDTHDPKNKLFDYWSVMYLPFRVFRSSTKRSSQYFTRIICFLMLPFSLFIFWRENFCIRPITTGIPNKVSCSHWEGLVLSRNHRKPTHFECLDILWRKERKAELTVQHTFYLHFPFPLMQIAKNYNFYKNLLWIPW